MKRAEVAPVLYPVCLAIGDLPVLVVGGGEVAARKLGGLAEAGARIVCVAPVFGDACKLLASRNKTRLRLVRRRFRERDLAGKRLVFAATDDLRLNARVAKLCGRQGIFCNVAAPPECGSFQLPAVVRRGGFCLTVSTGGASAHLAQVWRKKLERLAGPEWGTLAKLLEAQRRKIIAAIENPETRKQLLRKLGQPRFARRIRTCGAEAVGAEMDAIVYKFTKTRFLAKSRLHRRPPAR